MRTRHRILACLSAAVLGALGALATPSTAQAANLLSDPGFESGTLSDWSGG